MRFRHRLYALLTIALLAVAANGQTPETLRVAGLRQPVEVLKDRWGISHIYARNESDLFFAQGYNVARDRLFQLEIWRRQATGTVAEILGKKELQRDIGTRLFLFRGDLTQELNWYHPHGATIVQSFVNGINAYIAETERHPELLTPEFRMLGIKPQPWTTAVVISRFNGLLSNIDEEMNIALAVRTIGAKKVKELEYFQPPNPKLEMDKAIDPSLLSKDILALYDAFRTPIRFTPDELVGAYRGDADGALAELNADVSPGTEPYSLERQTIGSNNWVVGKELTPDGSALMANDPHRVQEAPSLRYWVHLVAPGWNVIGGGEPSLPGVSIGHNEAGAWGLTIFGNDEEDLYVYDTNPANPNQYKYKGAWETMRTIQDRIAVKGESPVAVELKYTRHGPVVFEDKAHHKAYAIRAAWMEIGSAPYLASLRMDQARSWEEFRQACSYSRIPSENMVWADVHGNIGYQAVGIEPRRPNWSGLVPVPGDGRYEWNGYLPILDLPNAYNPASGYLNSSNNYLIPNGWPFRDALHYLWADAFRFDEVGQVLGSGRKFTVADMVQLQNNVYSIPAHSLVPLLQDVSISAPATEQAQRQLLGWNYVLDRDSVPAGIYQMWQRRLTANMRDLMVPKEARPYFGFLSMTRIINWLEAPDGRFGADPIAGRDQMLANSLDEAVAELTRRFGPDMAKWRLGAFHHALIYHPFSPALTPELRSKFDVGPLPRGGDVYTIDATGNGDNQTAGGSFKIIADTSDWDNSVGLNNPGQSGDPNDAHYRDLFELWARGKYFPIFYSREKIESVTEKKLELEPAAAAPER
jgi:penicillin amidase